MTARIREAQPTSDTSTIRTFFVASAGTPGAWRRVDYTPGESLTCSCPHGRRYALLMDARSCWHMTAVTERMLDEVLAEVGAGAEA